MYTISNENVYIYVSGSAGVRPEEELPGCSSANPDEDPNTALFRIEIIQVPLDAPEEAAIVSSPRIFNDLAAPPTHGPSPADIDKLEEMVANFNTKQAIFIERWGPLANNCTAPKAPIGFNCSGEACDPVF